MSRIGIEKLTDADCRNASPKETRYKLADGGGLNLWIEPSGSKYWRLKYRFGGKEKVLALGVYPTATLKAARKAAKEARETLATDIDPGEIKRQKKLARTIGNANSFRAVALEWFEKEKPHWSEGQIKRVTRFFDSNLFPWLGSRPIGEINPPELLAVLRRTESKGTIETANRAKQVAGQVFRYAVATGRAERDPTPDLKGALATAKVRHHAAITDPKAVGNLLRAIDSYQGTPTVTAALKLSPLLFVRPGELRHMEWTEIDFDQARWEIPAEKMKMRQPHIVPLCHQAIEILRELEPITGRGRYVFPSARGASRPLSENGVRTALRTLGYSNDVMTPHGFRATARTILDEVLGYRPDLIEHQLAHAVRDPLGRAYNRTTHLPDREKMMAGWADYLDTLKAGGNVIPLRRPQK
ncbi:MAG TPA: integrase arm-type DNA-binding domain-containing protein [Spongiibacteraceae bacterium]|nr:integrase arm-type DNA-binding domain-containing protein [Spongiibacteraceae bacterium]